MEGSLEATSLRNLVWFYAEELRRFPRSSKEPGPRAKEVFQPVVCRKLFKRGLLRREVIGGGGKGKTKGKRTILTKLAVKLLAEVQK